MYELLAKAMSILFSYSTRANKLTCLDHVIQKHTRRVKFVKRLLLSSTKVPRCPHFPSQYYRKD